MFVVDIKSEDDMILEVIPYVHKLYKIVEPESLLTFDDLSDVSKVQDAVSTAWEFFVLPGVLITMTGYKIIDRDSEPLGYNAFSIIHYNPQDKDIFGYSRWDRIRRAHRQILQKQKQFLKMLDSNQWKTINLSEVPSSAKIHTVCASSSSPDIYTQNQLSKDNIYRVNAALLHSLI